MDERSALRAFAADRSEEAFATLVRTHADWVYSLCLRKLHNAHLAEEAAQAVFVVLAQRAAAIPHDRPLAAWLYRTAMFTVANMQKIERRKRAIQEKVQQASLHSVVPTSSDRRLELLDDALDGLKETDRTAVLLRFFENKTLAETGSALGISEAAAEKRVNRALDRLHTFLSQHGVVVGTVAIAAILARSSDAAPEHLSSGILKSIRSPSGNSTASNVEEAAKGAMKAMFWKRMQPLGVAGIVAALTLIGTFGVFGQENATKPADRADKGAEKKPAAADAKDNATPDAALASQLDAAIKSLEDDNFDQRVATEKKIEALVRKNGVSAFTLLETRAAAIQKGNHAESASRLVHIIDSLTLPSVAWHTQLSESMPKSERPVFDGKVLAQRTEEEVAVMDAVTGRRLWSQPGYGVSLGCIRDGLVYWIKPQVERVAPKTPDVELVAWKVNDGTLAWSKPFNDLYNIPYARIDPDLINDAKNRQVIASVGQALSARQQIVSLNEQGRVAWTIEMPGIKNCHSLSLDSTGTLLICGISMPEGSPDEMRAYNLSDRKLKYKTTLSEWNCDVGPVVLGDKAFFASQVHVVNGQVADKGWANYLVCASTADGKVLWGVNPTEGVTAAALGKVHDTLASASRTASGSTTFTSFAGNDLLRRISAPVASSDGKVICVRSQLAMTGYDAQTGKKLWTLPCLGYQIGIPSLAVEKDIVYAGCGTGEIMAVHIQDGRLAWHVDVNNLTAAANAGTVVEKNAKGAARKVGAIGDLTVQSGMIYGMAASGFFMALKVPEFERTQ